MRFLAYFDYLGFADFIERNDLITQRRIIGNNFRDIENALAKGKLKDGRPGYKIADLSDSSIHCINFSDTVIFWTEDNSVDSLKELLEVTHYYNWRCINYFFPARGAICLGEVISYKYNYESNKGGTYGVNSIFGKGLVKAHAKAESQDWAGTVIDESIIDFLNKTDINLNDFLSPFAKEFLVPYKKPVDNQTKEWVLNLFESKVPLNEIAYQNYKKSITDNFAKHNKRVDSESVQRKIANTLSFLDSYK